MLNTNVMFCGAIFKNPIVTASGTFGNGAEYGKHFDLSNLGGITTKAVTLEPRSGNEAPRIVETTGGMLNAIGLQNSGLADFCRYHLPYLQSLSEKGLNVIVNVSGSFVYEYTRITVALNGKVKFIEVNISCPNVMGEGMAFGQSAEVASQVVSAVRRCAGDLKVIVKLTPNVTDIVEIAKAVEDAGADAISLINTLLGMRIDPISGKFALANKTGGLSGPAIFPVAVRCVYQVAQAVKIPIIGMGGVNSGADVVEMMRAGATLVGVGTANFLDVDNRTPLRIIRELEEFCNNHGITKVADLIGATN